MALRSPSALAMNFSRPVEILFLAALAVGAVGLILLRDPEHFWQDAWIPALALVGIAMRRWWGRPR